MGVARGQIKQEQSVPTERGGVRNEDPKIVKKYRKTHIFDDVPKKGEIPAAKEVGAIPCGDGHGHGHGCDKASRYAYRGRPSRKLFFY